MFISASRNNNSISTFIVFIIFLGANIGLIFWEAGKGLSNEESLPIAEIIISSSTILLITFFLTFYLQKLKFTGIGDGIVGVVFLTFMLGFKDSYLYFKELFALFIILVVNARLISLHNKSKNFLQEFEIGCLLGLVIIICPSLIVFGIMFLIGLALVISFTWRDFVIPLMGVFLVFLLKVAYLFWIDSLILENIIQIDISYPEFTLELSLSKILIIFVSILEFGILIKLFRVIENKSIKERINYWIWIWTGFLLFISLLFFQKDFSKLMLIQFIGLPCSVFSIEYFKFKKNKKSVWKIELVFLCFLITQVALRIL